MYSLKGCAWRLWNSLASTANKTGCQQPTWQYSCEDPVLSWTRQLYQLIWSQHHRDNVTLEQFLCYFDGLVQERRNSIANALELCHSHANSLTCEGNPWVIPMGSPTKAIMWSFDVFFVVSLSKMPNRQWSWRCFETSHNSCVVSVMITWYWLTCVYLGWSDIILGVLRTYYEENYGDIFSDNLHLTWKLEWNKWGYMILCLLLEYESKSCADISKSENDLLSFSHGISFSERHWVRVYWFCCVCSSIPCWKTLRGGYTDYTMFVHLSPAERHLGEGILITPCLSIYPLLKDIEGRAYWLHHVCPSIPCWKTLRGGYTDYTMLVQLSPAERSWCEGVLITPCLSIYPTLKGVGGRVYWLHCLSIHPTLKGVGLRIYWLHCVGPSIHLSIWSCNFGDILKLQFASNWCMCYGSVEVLFYSIYVTTVYIWLDDTLSYINWYKIWQFLIVANYKWKILNSWWWINFMPDLLVTDFKCNIFNITHNTHHQI